VTALDSNSPDAGKEYGFSKNREDDAAAGVHVYAGALVVLDTSGNARPGRASTTDIAVGVAIEECDNTDGDAGDLTVKSRPGVYLFENSAAADEITAAEFMDTCYVVDDQTVAKTSNSGARVPAGRIIALVDGKVAVEIGRLQSGDGDLVSSNNLSDVGTPATARANIGANTGHMTLFVDDLVGANAKRVMAQAPEALTITKITSVLMGHALTTGDATLTAKIAGTGVTTGVITITQAGSAIADKDSCSPSALNVAAHGDLIEILVGGTNDNAAAHVLIE
jgi:hypothetical protein